MNEPPAMTDSLMEIGMGTGVNDEGDATVTSIGVPIGSMKEKASDEDTAHGDKLSFAITGGNIYKGVNPFAVNSDTGQLSVVQPLAATAECSATKIGFLTVCGDPNNCCMTAVFDEEEIKTDPPYQYQLILTVRDLSGLSDTATTIIKVKARNFPPTVDGATTNLNEDAAVGDVVVALSGRDIDSPPDPITYHLLSSSPEDATDQFVVDENTGIVTVKAGNTLNHEINSVYSLFVNVIDHPSIASKKPSMRGVSVLTITVDDVNENPLLLAMQRGDDQRRYRF